MPESLIIVTDFQDAERVALYIETAKLIPDDSELTSLFIQLRVIRNKKHPLYITRITSSIGLQSSLGQSKTELISY